MDHDRADVIGVRLKGGDLLARVVVVDADLAVAHGSVPAAPWEQTGGVAVQIIRPADNPVLPGNEAAGADGHVGKLECLDDLLGLVRPDVDMAAVESRCSYVSEGGRLVGELAAILRIHGSVGWKSMPLTRCSRTPSACEVSWTGCPAWGGWTTYLGASKKLALYVEAHVSNKFAKRYPR